jgi:peptidase E
MASDEKPTLRGSIFLAGGGVSAQSAKVDAAFVECCIPDLPIVYIPNAMRGHPRDQSLSWFRSLMAPHRVRHIEMWDHLQPQHPPEEIAGVYISGGDTGHLLDELRLAGFDQYLRSVLAAGNPIYGQSAGAIVLGEALVTSKAAAASGREDAPGLGFVTAHAIACHYSPDDDDRLSTISRVKGVTVIAISDDAGAVFADGKVTSVGGLPVSIFHPDGHRSTV